MLSDKCIKKAINKDEIVINNYQDFESQLQPASFDFYLDNDIVKLSMPYENFHKQQCLDLQDINNLDKEPCQIGSKGFKLEPKGFILGTTKESLKLSNNYCAKVTGRSSIGRLGITVHVTAGFIDPGFEGNVTLEIANLANYPIKLREGIKIGQFTFHELSSSCDKGYGEKSDAKYNKQQSVVPSKFEGAS